VVICAGGQRSTIACSILQKHGFKQLLNVLGGMDTWNRVGFETVRK
jgi:hydroxyacylglutathione hydrolase